MKLPFTFEHLSPRHERQSFHCGSDPLDGYFKTLVTQDIRRNLTSCFVAVEAASGFVAGYYTLAAASIHFDHLPDHLKKKLPRYPLVPAFRLGRFAIATTHQGKGLGGAMLIDAFLRTIRSEIAAFALVVDAKDSVAAAFYQHHGFLPVQEEELVLYLPLAEVARRLSHT